MHDLASPSVIGTIPQWGTFIAMLTILAGCVTIWIKGIPERLRARTDSRSSAVKHWVELEARVTGELKECRQESAACTKRIIVLEDENYRLRIAMTMVLGELERHDPGSDFIKRAQAVMVAAAGSIRTGV